MTDSPRTSLRFGTALRTLFVASRPLSWVNTAFPFAAAYLISQGHVDAVLIVGALFFLIPYNLLMYGVNDVFDYESDLANPRKGGVQGAKVAPEQHRMVLVCAFILPLPFLVFLVLAGASHPVSWVVLALSIFAVIAYSVPTLRFKEVPILDSITSSTHFVSPAVFSLALTGTTVTAPLVCALVAFFLWGMASHAFGAVQDIGPDTEAGISSVATVLGARTTVRGVIALWIVAGLLMLATPWPALLAATFSIPYIVNAAPYASVTNTDSASVTRAWGRFLWINYSVGFLTTLLMIVSFYGGLFA